MRFSQRIGKTEVRTVFQREGISNELRNSLWSIILTLFIESQKTDDETKFFSLIWLDFFKYPIDNLPTFHDKTVSHIKASARIREWYYSAQWYEVLDFIEFLVEQRITQHEIREQNYDFREDTIVINNILQREMSAYRFIDNILVEINSEEEILEIENALANTDQFAPVKTHLQTALKLLGDKKNPDYRNSIKESISAVESLIRMITRKNKFSDALAELDKLIHIPKSLKEGFNKLYGYTSSKVGIRHAILDEEAKVDLEEARFMLVTCSAFVNYVISKYADLTSKI